MSKRNIAFTIVSVLQLVSAIALFPAFPHLANIWYRQELGWFQSFKTEYADGGWAMILEFIVIGLAVIFTIAFQIWLFSSGDRENRKNTEVLRDISKNQGAMAKTLKAIAEKLGVAENEADEGKTTRQTKIVLGLFLLGMLFSLISRKKRE